MVTHTQNLSFAFNPSKCTHSSEHTHTLNTHPEQWAAILHALFKGTSVVVLRVEESAGYSLAPPTIPAGPETRTPQTLGYKSDFLSIRPQLPLDKIKVINLNQLKLYLLFTTV